MTGANEAQADYWSSAVGRKWAIHQDLLNSAFRAVNLRLLALARPGPGERALDIGCGTGATTADFAARLSPGGSVLSLDISPPLLEEAEANMADLGITNVTFLHADAQTHAFEGESFDLLFSRFGVMFFEDPVAAFVNLLSAARPGGRLVMAAWCEPESNPWFEIPRDAALSRLGRPPPTDPRDPGPWAFADADYVTGILGDAGWSNVECTRETIELEHDGTVEEMGRLASNIGPASRIMRHFEGTQEDQDAITRATIGEFQRFGTREGVRIPAQLNFLRAIRT